MVYLDELKTIIPRTDKSSSEYYSIKLTNIQTNEEKIISDLVNISEHFYYYEFEFEKYNITDGQYELEVLSENKVVYRTLAQKGYYNREYKEYNKNKTTYKVYKS